VLVVMIWWIVCLWIDEPPAATLIPNEEANTSVAVETLDTWIQEPPDSEAAPEE
jgi:hypothetical protein